MVALVELSRWIYLAALRLTDLCVDRFPGPLAQAVTSARLCASHLSMLQG